MEIKLSVDAQELVSNMTETVVNKILEKPELIDVALVVVSGGLCIFGLMEMKRRRSK